MNLLSPHWKRNDQIALNLVSTYLRVPSLDASQQQQQQQQQQQN